MPPFALSFHLPNGPTELIVSLLAIAGLAAVVYVARQIDPAWLLSGGIATDVFVGSGAKLGVPISPSRVLIAAGSLALIARATRDGRRFPLRPQPLHLLLVAVSLWALGSAYLSGTLHQQGTLYELLDRLGVVPYWMFFLAPLAFATERQRRILLGTLIALGGYLGLTALFEILKLNSLVWPKYILDPAYGSHGDRARGPFVEAIANGVALFECGVAATMGLAIWRDRRARVACAAVAALCVAGCLFTLTREVWLGAAVGALLALAGFAELRRFLLHAVVIGATTTVLALAIVPGFSGSFHSRTHDQSSIWVRKNVARAAINMINAKPLLGFGWNGFVAESPPYFRSAGSYPLIGIGVPAHNLPLRNAVELGLIGATLWALALALGLGGAIFVPPDTPELRLWRIGLVAMAADLLVIINFAPSSYPFPTLLVWTWAGLIGSTFTLPELAPARRRAQIALVTPVRSSP